MPKDNLTAWAEYKKAAQRRERVASYISLAAIAIIVISVVVHLMMFGNHVENGAPSPDYTLLTILKLSGIALRCLSDPEHDVVGNFIISAFTLGLYAAGIVIWTPYITNPPDIPTLAILFVAVFAIMQVIGYFIAERRSKVIHDDAEIRVRFMAKHQ